MRYGKELKNRILNLSSEDKAVLSERDAAYNQKAKAGYENWQSWMTVPSPEMLQYMAVSYKISQKAA